MMHNGGAPDSKKDGQSTASPYDFADHQPTKGVRDLGTTKRPRTKIDSENLSDARGTVAAPTTDGEDIAEIGTHRKESNMEEN